MKTNIAYKSINVFIISIILMISFSTIVIGQEKEFDSEILVYFLPDSLEMDEGITELNDMSKLKIKSKSLDNVIKKIELKSIKKAFPDFNEADMIKIRKDGKKIKLPNMSRIFRLKLNTKNDVESAINSLSKEKGVLFAEPNMDAELFGDDDYSKQWHLNNTGQSGGVSGADIDAPEAWNIFTGSSSIKIGVIDSGVDIYHEDLTGKVSGDATTGDYHGTHVAGIAAAKANNTHGGRGVDWNAQIVSKQIFDGNGNYLGDANTYNKIISAVNAGANILNHSWGSTSYSSTVRMAFSYAYKMDRVATVAMGNDYQYGNPTKYPAAFGQGVIAVGSTKDDDLRSPFSQSGTHIDVVAPGGVNPYPNNDQHDIWSTWSNNGYRYLAGTSMATPIVSGIASLLKGYNTNLENDDIENIIKLGIDDKGATGWDIYYGTGRVNAKKALDYLRAPYILEQNSVTGGSVYSSTGTYTTAFYGVSGLATAVYIVKRYEVRKTVSLNSAYSEKYIWGRGVNTVGFSLASPNYGMGWCGVVSSSGTSATLRTYIYQVWSSSGTYLGYYPTTASNVKYEYTVLGNDPPPAAPQNLSVTETTDEHPFLSWDANTESDLKEYNVYRKGGYPFVDWTIIATPDSNSYKDDEVTTTYSHGEDFFYKITAVDNNDNESDYSNTVEIEARLEKQMIDEEKVEEAPKVYALNSNYPNPFNPTTQISYQIPNDGFVNLSVFNSLGQEVAVLVDQQQSVGRYTIQFNANNLSSGIYFYRIASGEFNSVKKMLLVR